MNSPDRQNFYTTNLIALFGIRANWNIGFTANIKASHYNLPNESAFNTLAFANTTDKRFGLASIGPFVRFAPFKNKGITVQTSLNIPMTDSMEYKSDQTIWLDHDKYSSFTQLFYTKNINRDWQLFSEFDLFYQTDRHQIGSRNHLTASFKSIMSYFPNGKTTAYGLFDLSPKFIGEWGPQHYLQIGVGSKYLITNNFEIELMLSNFIWGINVGNGTTHNLGIRRVI